MERTATPAVAATREGENRGRVGLGAGRERLRPVDLLDIPAKSISVKGLRV